MTTLSVVTPLERASSVATTARILPSKSPAPSTLQRSEVPPNHLQSVPIDLHDDLPTLDGDRHLDRTAGRRGVSHHASEVHEGPLEDIRRRPPSPVRPPGRPAAPAPAPRTRERGAFCTDA